MNEKQDVFDRIMSRKIMSPFLPLYRKYKSVLLYLFFGVLTTLVNIFVFAALTISIRMQPLIANIFAWIAAVTFAYFTNRIWVFHSEAEGSRELLKECISFYMGRLLTLVLEEGVLILGINLMHQNEMAVKLIAQFLVVIANYFVSKLLVFRQK